MTIFKQKTNNSKNWQDNSDGWVTTMNKSKEDKEAYRWCVNHGIKIGVLAATPGFDVGSWKIRIVANNKEMISPGDYSRTEIYPKVFEMYRHYHKLNTKGNR